jgi:hypothetical protein
MPREVVSVGTFGMAAGQGGNCGREPIVAIRRMGTGDALFTVQEYRVTTAMRGHLSGNFASPPRLGRLVRAAGAYAGDAAGAPLYTATILFHDSGRAFDALVYSRGRPTADTRAQFSALLAGLDFGPHPAEFGSDG